ncbi:MAG: B12-binding domain-containing radical SAM protein [Candidatus Bathyarchaeota archaeon]|nr:B12-binding domain-containing radical SAM protein [Candidatus Bathyarchaeota archaeon]
MKQPEVLLTCDRTLMSNYHGNEFIGFGTCAPPNFIPEWFYSFLFFPPIRTSKGVPFAAPYGLRKVEAQLLKEGFSVATVSPQHLKQHASRAKVIGIHAMDPFGLGPASTTLAAILKKEPYLAKHFQALLCSSAVKEAKKNGAKIIVGGPGAWQFRYRPQFVEEYEIDCVVDGEAESALGEVFKTALNGGDLPRYYDISAKDAPALDEIPNIVGPSINGLVEIGRGCCRGCEFCNVTLRPLRWYPYEKILREMSVNRAGGLNMCCLHAEDVMLYGSRSTVPDDAKLVKLHELVMKNCDSISWSHCSLAAVAANPKLFSRVSEIIRRKQTWWGAEIGIETGSPALAKKIMPAKAHPFRAEEWPEVVKAGMGILHDNMMVPACTLIVGLPEEREEDVLKTMELVDDLKHCRSLIVPLFFVPLGRLRSRDWFKTAEMTELHKQLLFQCAEHDFYWLDDLIDLAFAGKWYVRFLREFYRVFAGIAKQKARKVEVKVLQ